MSAVLDLLQQFVYNSTYLPHDHALVMRIRNGFVLPGRQIRLEQIDQVRRGRVQQQVSRSQFSGHLPDRGDGTGNHGFAATQPSEDRQPETLVSGWKDHDRGLTEKVV